jgi:hypothetical protein
MANQARFGPRSRSGLSLLANVLYAGLTRHHKRWIEANHPPIVDRALFDEVASLLQSRQPRRTRAEAPEPALLAGVLLCEQCGGSMDAIYAHEADDRAVPSYACVSATACVGTAVPAAAIERAVVEHVRGLSRGGASAVPDRATLERLCERISYNSVTECVSLVLRESDGHGEPW